MAEEIARSSKDEVLRESGGDSGPLDPEQLSDRELQIIFEIERSLEEARSAVSEDEFKGIERYLKRVENRPARVLLLDGGRGTGKTSILLTLVERWHHHVNPNSSKGEIARYEQRYKDRIEQTTDHGALGRGMALNPIDTPIPRNLRVLDILDFDPLPPGMPLIAGIMQAWQPLAETYDQHAQGQASYQDDDEGGLMDRWYRLFQTAAAGWGAVSNEKGLLEQVLDRQEQVEDWQRLGAQWRSFVSAVLRRGNSLRDEESLPQDAMFVIMIDDCDLQAQRIRQLLPTLRMLYHPNVFFLVAADRKLILDMVSLDYFGQQNDLAGHRNVSDTPLVELVRTDRWAQVLAKASFSKVFPVANQWKLERLSLLEFLGFPGLPTDLPDGQLSPVESGAQDAAIQEEGSSNFLQYLNELKGNPHSKFVDAWKSSPLSAGDLILRLARTSRDLLPGVITYRSAHQLIQHVMRFQDPEQRATEVLSHLIGRHGQRNLASAVEVKLTGVLGALYRPGPRVVGGAYDVVLSNRPDFVFIGGSGSDLWVRMSTEPDGRFNFAAGLAAKALEEEGFPVEASSLLWETYASHAWTEWFQPQALFAWTRHEHPNPVKLFENNAEWGNFVQHLIETNEAEDAHRLERYAYMWVHLQRKWAGVEVRNSSFRVPDDLKEEPEEWPWNGLLDFSAITNKEEKILWTSRTLPLLARPEIGFPPSIQEKLLSLVEGESKYYSLLQRQRHRLITDAIIAAGIQRREYAVSTPTDQEVEDMAARIDVYYAEAFGGVNHWTRVVGSRESNAEGK